MDPADEAVSAEQCFVLARDDRHDPAVHMLASRSHLLLEVQNEHHETSIMITCRNGNSFCDFQKYNLQNDKQLLRQVSR